MRSVAWAIVTVLFLAGCGSCGGGSGKNNGNNGKNNVTADSCDDVTCHADATCDDSGETVECICKPGFEGDGFDCEEIVVTCEEATDCGDTGSCVDGLCECSDGYALEAGGCADTDECATATDDCDDNASCANTDGGFVCTCSAGWEGDGKSCSDFDECAAGADDCTGDHVACMNIEGGFECGCDDGYTGDGRSCSLLVDCNADPDACDPDATCTDTPDGTACVCDEGFAGDGATCRQTGFTVIRAGNNHTCGLRRDGTLACWGTGSPVGPRGGYIWDVALTEPTPDASGATWTYLAEGIGKACAILDDGTIWCQGTQSMNQVGMDSDWKKVATSTAAYQGFTCGIKTNGQLWCWGDNQSGQLGDGTTEEQTDPVQIAGNWEHVSLGSSHGCGLKTDGTIWCWGGNDRGQLGDPDAANPSTPIQVTDADDWETFQTVAYETCARKTNGQVWCWGGYLQAEQTPSRVGPTTWKDFSTNGSRQCGIHDDGTLWCKGTGLWGEHGSDMPNLLEFNQVGSANDWASVITGFEHTCALDESGEAWCWGHNNAGQIGVGSLGGIKPTPARVSPGTSFKDADAGQAHACAIAANGALYCTGSNTITQLGLGRMTLHEQSMTRVGNATNWASVEAGIQHTCAVRDDGSLWCTGFNGGGQLGLGEGVNPMGSFVRVGNDSDWAAYRAAPTWSCALKSGGELYCFGINESGQLGTGDTEQRFVPTRAGSETYADFDTGGYYTDRGHTCAIRDSDDSLWCWGNNDEGQLGTGDQEPVMQPTQIGDATWAQIRTGGGYTCGIQTDGTLWCWGVQRLGALGLGRAAGNVLEPTQVGSATDWRQVSTGFQHTCATKTNDEAWCWGDIALIGNGEVSAGSNTSPVQVGMAAQWSELHADYTSTWGIKTDGSLWSWGINRDGQLGTGDAWYITPQRVLD